MDRKRVHRVRIKIIPIAIGISGFKTKPIFHIKKKRDGELKHLFRFFNTDGDRDTTCWTS